MQISVYTMTVETFLPMLANLSKQLDKAGEFATAKKFDVAVLANARLAPDMFSLVKQVQLATDFAKSGTARLAGVEPPKFEDNEETLALRQSLGLDVVEQSADVGEKGVGHEPPRFDDGEAASLTAHNRPRYGDTWRVGSSRPR